MELNTTKSALSVTSRVVAGAQWMFAWRIISRALGFISVLILANLLAPSDFGIVAVATTISGAIDGLSQLGVRDALVRLADERKDFYDAAFTIQVGRGLLTGALIFGSAHYASIYMQEPRVTGILLVLACVTVVAGFENIGVVSFTRELEFRVLFFLQAGPRLIGFLTTTLMAFLLHSYWALIAGSVIAKVSGVIASYIVSPHRPRFGFTGWRYLVHFSFWTWLGGLVLVFLQRSDSFLLAPMLGASAFGLYVLAGELASLPVTELLEPACIALFPGFAMARRGGSTPSAMGLSVAGSLALFTVPFSIGISACSGYLVTALLGPNWDAAQPLVAVLAWSSMFLPFSWVTVVALSAQGNVRQVVASHAIAAALKVGGILAVLHTHDIHLITLTMVGIVAVESLMFIGQLRAAGNRELRSLAMTALRALPSIGITVAVLATLPGVWVIVTIGRVEALLVGGTIGAVTFPIFFLCQAVQWHLAGRPPGAEQRIADILTSHPRVIQLRRLLKRSVGV